MIRPAAIGWRAHAALCETGGAARVLAVLTGSVYLTAGTELVWLGGPRSTLHPRAVLARDLPPLARFAEGDTLGLDVAGLAPWAPRRLPEASAIALAAGCRALVAALGRVGTPDGFGTLLIGAMPSFPLDRVVERVGAFWRACAAGEPEAAAHTASALLGLGPGLTPSGDDLVGGAFFARRLIARGAPAERAWREAADRVLAEAPGRTHPISLALLHDLLDGQGHAPLHDLAGALAAGTAGTAVAVEAACGLIRIGHSSGWDLLTGVVAGCGGAAGPPVDGASEATGAARSSASQPRWPSCRQHGLGRPHEG